MPFQNNVLAGASGATGYEIPYSLRFRRSNSPYMTRTAGTPTNAKIATWSFWHKRGALGPEWVWGQITSGASTFFTFDSGIAATLDSIRIYVSGTNLTSTPVFRDPSAWYHFVVAVDTTQATAADRIKVYVNNQAVTMSGTITLNADITFNVSGKLLKIGDGTWFATSADYIDGYLAEFNFIDGQALTPSSFGQTDATTGVWVPKKYSGTYGTNGFYLKFADASAATAAAIGKDSSGNGNNWTPSGISVTSGVTFDQMLDTPTLNYCVLNPVNPTGSTLSNANLSASIPFATNSIVKGSISPSTGKWYWEVTVTSGGVGTVGILVDGAAESYYPGYTSADGISYNTGGTVYRTGSVIQTYTSFTTNDVIGIALDLDNGKVFFSKNGTWQGSSDPAAGTNPAASTNISGKTWNAANGNNSAAAAGHAFNFGQRAFSYTPPTGFKALNTANLPTPSIKKGSLYMDATLRTGTGATASVSSLGFQPDLVWIKSRSAATDHGLYDAVRGVQKQIESNTTTAETTETTGLTAFNSNGYTVGALAQLNTSAATYVDWAWKEGATPGFDIVAYTGTGSALNVSHALGAVPKFMVIKAKDNTVADNWGVYHGSLPNTQNLYLNLTNGAATASMWNSTTPTSSVFTVGANNDVNRSGLNYISYLWSEIEGFSKFGSYTGNGSTDGPFVWCGAKVRWLMVKRSDTSGSWVVIDAARAPFNEANARVFAELPDAEVATTAVGFDFLASGFKARQTNANINASGGTYIFAAFAENPFKYARAR